MSSRKQELLKKHRRRKRIILVITVVLLLLLSLFAPWWSLPLFILGIWVVHEAWFADHLFYTPDQDYQYLFPEGTAFASVKLIDGKLQINDEIGNAETLFLQWYVRSSWLGRWLDPQIYIGDDRQDMERGVNGLRYFNISGCLETLQAGTLSLRGRFCRLASEGYIWGCVNPDYADQTMMILAPHSDDAELAAFGQYSRSTEVTIVTVTQGEIEAENYQKFGLDKAAAARLKGRLRTWDSVSVPLWGGVSQENCVQLGYYCLQLPAMREEPAKAFGSRESEECDTRSARKFNSLVLPGDSDGAPTWHNLTADLVALLEHAKPQVVLTPHPELDPHSDHVACTQALMEAINVSSHRPQTLLLYANHLHDNDRWPMGPAGGGIALPPVLTPLPADKLWSPALDHAMQIDKAMALAMQHDLQTPLPFKRRLRRLLQKLLVGRSWPKTGDDEFFRKSVRRHELFWVRHL